MTTYLELFINFLFLQWFWQQKTKKGFGFLRSFSSQPLEAVLKLHVWKVKTIWGSLGCDVLIVQAENHWGEGEEIREVSKLLLWKFNFNRKFRFAVENFYLMKTHISVEKVIWTKHFTHLFSRSQCTTDCDRGAMGWNYLISENLKCRQSARETLPAFTTWCDGLIPVHYAYP